MPKIQPLLECTLLMKWINHLTKYSNIQWITKLKAQTINLNHTINITQEGSPDHHMQIFRSNRQKGENQH